MSYKTFLKVIARVRWYLFSDMLFSLYLFPSIFRNIHICECICWEKKVKKSTETAYIRYMFCGEGFWSDARRTYTLGLAHEFFSTIYIFDIKKKDWASSFFLFLRCSYPKWHIHTLVEYVISWQHSWDVHSA